MHLSILPTYRKDGCTYDLATLLLTLKSTPDLDSVKLYMQHRILSILNNRPCTTPFPKIGPEAQWMLEMSLPFLETDNRESLSAMLSLVT